MCRTFNTLLFGLLMGYCLCFGCIAQNAFAAPRVLARRATISLSGKQAYDQNKNTKHFEDMEKWLHKADSLSTHQIEKKFQSNLMKSTYSSDYSAQSSFSIPWLPVKIQDLSFLWTQQRDKQKKKDMYDYGE